MESKILMVSPELSAALSGLNQTREAIEKTLQVGMDHLMAASNKANEDLFQRQAQVWKRVFAEHPELDPGVGYSLEFAPDGSVFLHNSEVLQARLNSEAASQATDAAIREAAAVQG